MQTNLTVKTDKVLETIDKFPEAKSILESLFPEIQETMLDKKRFITIGQIFVKIFKHNNNLNVYSLFLDGNIVRVRNVKHNTIWKSVSLKIDDTRKDYLTQYEFKILMKGASQDPIKDFTPIPNSILISYTTSPYNEDFKYSL